MLAINPPKFPLFKLREWFWR